MSKSLFIMPSSKPTTARRVYGLSLEERIRHAPDLQELEALATLSPGQTEAVEKRRKELSRQ